MKSGGRDFSPIPSAFCFEWQVDPVEQRLGIKFNRLGVPAAELDLVNMSAQRLPFFSAIRVARFQAAAPR